MPRPTQLPLFATRKIEGIEYDRDFILNNPIPAVCVGPKPHPEQIKAPSLENVRCFWCGQKMRPRDPVSYQARLKVLPQYVTLRCL